MICHKSTEKNSQYIFLPADYHPKQVTTQSGNLSLRNIFCVCLHYMWRCLYEVVLVLICLSVAVPVFVCLSVAVCWWTCWCEGASGMQSSLSRRPPWPHHRTAGADAGHKVRTYHRAGLVVRYRAFSQWADRSWRLMLIYTIFSTLFGFVILPCVTIQIKVLNCVIVCVCNLASWK